MPRFAPMLELPPAAVKPRQERLTMVFDRGWPSDFIEGVLTAYPNAVDIAKVSAWHIHQPEDVVQRKIAMYERHGVEVQVGGPILEIARAQDHEEETLTYLRDLGFKSLEVSSEARPTQSSIDEDRRFAEKCKRLGFAIHGEVGKKFAEGDQVRRTPTDLDVDKAVEFFEGYVDMGAHTSYLEGHLLRAVLGNMAEREAGRPQILELGERVGTEHIIFEIPGTFLPYAGKRALQALLVYMFGPNVNVGNVLIEEVAELEEIRDGLFPAFGAPNGDHPWLRSIIESGTGRAAPEWWKG